MRSKIQVRSLPVKLVVQTAVTAHWARQQLLLFGCRISRPILGMTSKKTRHVFQCWFNVGPASQAVRQHLASIGSMCHVCEVIFMRSCLNTKQNTEPSHLAALYSLTSHLWLICIIPKFQNVICLCK